MYLFTVFVYLPSRAAGRELKIRHLATELNVLYTIERILKNSAIVRNAVREHGLELQTDGSLIASDDL